MEAAIGMAAMAAAMLFVVVLLGGHRETCTKKVASKIRVGRCAAVKGRLDKPLKFLRPLRGRKSAF